MGSNLPMGGMGDRNWGSVLYRENLLLKRVASAAGSLIKGKFDMRQGWHGRRRPGHAIQILVFILKSMF